MDTKVEILYPAPLPAPTDEEWEKIQPLIDKAVAEGNPWAAAAGIFRKDPYFDEWLAAMREYRREVEEDPDY